MSERPFTIVTGASSGIGEAMARLFAERDRPLVLVARRTERLEQLARELRRPDLPVEVMSADLGQPGAPDALMAELRRRGLGIHTLVNNAGFGLRGRFTALPQAEQLAMLQLNVVALTALCRIVLPDLLARRAGGIINVASTAAFQAIPSFAVYAASKAYVLSLSEALHEEARPHGVVVTAICPGPTATEFASRANMEGSLLFKNSMSAERVARLGIDGYEAGRAIVVTGGTNRVGAAVAGLLPRAWVRRVAGRLQG